MSNIIYDDILKLNIDKQKTVCFTGHRIVNNYELCELDFEITRAFYKGYDTFLSGGAIGFDQCAAFKILGQKRRFPIRLILVLPCPKEIMSINWSDDEKGYIDYLCQHADGVICLSENYYNGCMKERNKKLVELSNYCIAYYKKYKSGTGQTVRFMQKKGGTIVNLVQK